MQEKITPQIISRYRQEMGRLINEIEKLSFRCLYEDSLIQGTPGTVYRTCGKASCKCMKSKEDRHGPYYVIQVYKDGKQRQISLTKNQKHLWDKAKNYQYQIQKLNELKERCHKLQELVNEVIEKRTEEFNK